MFGQILVGILPLALKVVSYFIEKAQLQKESRMAFLLVSQELQKTFALSSIRFGDSFREAEKEIEEKKALLKASKPEEFTQVLSGHP